MKNHFSGLDWIVLFVYFLGTMSIGFYFWRKSRSVDGFTAAERSLPGWVCGLSIFASYLSSISFLALPGKAYASNWNPFVFSLSLPLATWIAVKYFLPYYRRSGDVSAYAALENRFGAWARMYASVFYLLTQIARIGAVMYLMAIPLNVLLGWDISTIIIITGISVTVYSFVGGIVAVIWSDALQAIILMAGAVVCSLVMVFGMPQGAGQIFSIAAEHEKFSLGSFGFSVSDATFWVVLIYGVVMNLQNFGIDQSYVQRYIASSSTREARKGLWLGGLLYVPISALFLFIGTQLFAYYEVHPQYLDEVKTVAATQQLTNQGILPEMTGYQQQLDQAAVALTVADVGDKVFPHFIGSRMPRGITGLLIAAIFAAAMSTVSTSLNSSATLLMTDWYKRYINKTAGQKQSMLVLYGGTVTWGILGTGVSLLLINVTSALDAWWTLSGIFGGGMLGLFLLGMICRKAGNPASVTGVILGIAVICWLTLTTQIVDPSSPFRIVLHAYMIPVIGTLTILLTGLLVSRLSGRRTKRVESL